MTHICSGMTKHRFYQISQRKVQLQFLLNKYPHIHMHFLFQMLGEGHYLFLKKILSCLKLLLLELLFGVFLSLRLAGNNYEA